ncbi:hypothetical protein HAX54_037965 [Datura stramonium]|uniref:Uncharacterized protein n=1 Tax=Datura stramonium TaxID=4076 RepID=A0ABS8VLG2_DATST|nr:hypothetical protein [Datura stramonium]
MALLEVVEDTNCAVGERLLARFLLILRPMLSWLISRGQFGIVSMSGSFMQSETREERGEMTSWNEMQPCGCPNGCLIGNQLDDPMVAATPCVY